MSELSQIHSYILKYIASNDDLDTLLVKFSGNEIIIRKKTEHKIDGYTVEDLKKDYNNFATMIGAPKVNKISGRRLKAITKALSHFPEKKHWSVILNGIKRDPFWSSIIDFDKLYRNERYYEFYEKGIQEKTGDSLLDFFNKYSKQGSVNGSTKPGDERHRKKD